jgi:hypothetical protein
MTTDDWIQNIQQLLDDFNRGDLEQVQGAFSGEYFVHVPKEDEAPARQVLGDLFSDLRGAFSGLQASLEDTRAEGDHLLAAVRLQGIHDGPLWGAPASHQAIDWPIKLKFRQAADGGLALNLEEMAPPVIMGMLRPLDLIRPPDQMHLPPKHPAQFPELLTKVMFTGQVADKPCSHLSMIRVTDPEVLVCESCVESGDIWPALRMCLTCGYVGCCDTSINKHAKKHAEETGHPLIRSIRLDESWIWCYEDQAFFSGRLLDRYR